MSILNKLFKSFTIIGVDGQPYLRRYYILKTRWFRIYLHEILRSDEDRDCHDHPWNFTSIILKGGYWETRELWEESGFGDGFAVKVKTRKWHGVGSISCDARPRTRTASKFQPAQRSGRSCW